MHACSGAFLRFSRHRVYERSASSHASVSNQLAPLLPGSEEGLCLNAHERGPAPLVLHARRAPAYRCLHGHGCAAQAQEAAALRVAPPGSLQRRRRGVQAPQARAGGKPAEHALDCHRSLAQTAAGSASECLLNPAQCFALGIWLIHRCAIANVPRKKS